MANQFKEKKRGCGCGGCLLGFILGLIVILAVGLGVGYYFANKYTKNKFDLSVKEIVKIVDGLYKVDGDKIVDNAPTAADEIAFYNTLGEKLYLKEGTLNEQTFGAITDSILGGDEESEPESEPEGEPTEGEGEVLSASKRQALAVRAAAANGDAVSALENLICRDNIDLELINDRFGGDVEYDYNTNYETDFVAEVTDKQLMALIAAVLEEVGSENEILSEIEFKQLTLSRNGEDQPVIELVARMDVKGVVVPLLSKLPAFAAGLVEKFVPDEIYLTAALTLGDEVTTECRVNNFNEKQQKQLYKLVDGILKLAKQGDKSAEELVEGTISDVAGDLLVKADEYLKFDENVGDHTFKLDVFNMIASTVFNDEGQDVTGVQLAKLYTTVLTADTAKLVEENQEHLYRDKWVVGGREQWSEAPLAQGERIDYEQEFLKELRSKYLIHTSYYTATVGEVKKTYFEPMWQMHTSETERTEPMSATDFGFIDAPTDSNGKPVAEIYRTVGSSSYTTDKPESGIYETYSLVEYVELGFDDLAALMGVGTKREELEGVNLQALFDSSLLTKEVGGNENDDPSTWHINQPVGSEVIKFNLNEKMLAALVNAQAQTLFSDSSEGALNSNIEVLFVALDVDDRVETLAADAFENAENAPSTYQRKVMTVGFTVDAKGLMEGADFVAGLLGDSVALSVKLDISPELKTESLLAPELYYSNFDRAKTDEMINIIESMGLTIFDEQTLKTQLGEPIRDIIKKMSIQLGDVVIKDATVKHFEGGSAKESTILQTPDAFNLLAAQMFAVKPDKTYGDEPIVLNGSDIHVALQGIYNPLKTANLNSEKPDVNYYVNDNGGAGNVYDLAVFNNGLPSTRGTNNQWNKVDNLSMITGINADVSAMPDVFVNMPAVSEDLMHVVGYYEQGGANGADNRMFITYEFVLDYFLDSNTTGRGLMSVDKAYATFCIDKSSVLNDGEHQYYETKIIVNEMAYDEGVLTLRKIMTYYDKNHENEFTDLENQVGRLAYYIVNNSMIHNFVDTGTVSLA